MLWFECFYLSSHKIQLFCLIKNDKLYFLQFIAPGRQLPNPVESRTFLSVTRGFLKVTMNCFRTNQARKKIYYKTIGGLGRV